MIRFFGNQNSINEEIKDEEYAYIFFNNIISD